MDVPLLYPQDWLLVLLSFEKKPDFDNEKVVLEIDEKPLEITRGEAIDFVKKIPDFVLDPKESNHAYFWQEARKGYLANLIKTTENQIDPMKLKELEDNLKAAELRQVEWKKTHEVTKMRLAGKSPSPEEEAKIEADNRNTEKLEQPQQETIITGAELRRTPQEVAHVETPAPRVQTKRPVAESNSLLVKWKSFTQNPLGEIKKLFTSTRTADRTSEKVEEKIASVSASQNSWQKIKNLFQRNRQVVSAAKTVVAGTGKAVAGGLGKQSFGVMLKKGAAGFLAKFGLGAAGGPVTWALLAASLLKKVLSSERLKSLASKALILTSAGIYFLWANIPGLILGSLGGIIGAPLGVGAAATGFGAGFALGMGLQKIAASLLGGGGTVGFGTAGSASAIGSSAGGVVAPVASISVGAFTIPANVAGAISGVGSFLGGSWVAQLAVIGIGGGIGALLLSVTITLAAVLQQPEQQTNQGQSQEAIFTLKKEAITPEFTSYDEGPITVSYKLTIQQGTNPITIESITDKLTRSNNSSWLKNVNIPISQSTYDVEISGPEFKDTYLYNLVTVKVKDNVTGNEETKTASTQVKIGQPLEQKKQPYGYPAGGFITTLDDDTIVDAQGKIHVHSSCFMNFSPCRWFNGGIDIAPRGGDPIVRATMGGRVVKSEFMRSSTSAIADVGGVVYIQSDDGLYIAEYMHLDSDGLIGQGQTVSRGSTIGKVFLGQLGAITGPHVHYQVLFNNANLIFNDVQKVGNCSEGKILETLPVQGQTVPAGPFVCQ